ncbi:MAG: hypothetical protein OYH77_07845 [Pseudomonadota bacterium]|nr:hypothetical protein [Pseudomonadota bacterium]
MLTIALVFLILQACVQPQGELLISANAATAANYSVYRIDAEQPLQLLAKHRGIFNQRLALTTGDYLVLADCSHTRVQIKAGQLTELRALHLEFIPPPVRDVRLALQCAQFERLNLRQHFNAKFNFWLLAPQADLLIAAKQMTVDFQDKDYLGINLSALRVDATAQHEDYFVYPHDNLLAVAQRQPTGEWAALLAGDYVVEFNGIRKTVSLLANEPLSLPVVGLVVDANHASAREVALFNAGKTLYFNQPFITLPTTLSLHLHRSSSPLAIVLTQDKKIKVRSVMIVPPCASKSRCEEQHLRFFLYEAGEKVPFVSAKIGERVFFARDDVRLAIEGSQGITYRLPNTKRDMLFNLGKLKLNYLTQKHHQRYTDLLRLEAQADEMQGNSIDLRFGADRGTLLIAGKYSVAHYVSDAEQNSDREAQAKRRRYLKTIRIVAGQTTVHRQLIIARK